MAVTVNITTHNVEMNDRLHDYVTKKVSKLDRYLDILEEATVDLAYAKSARSAADRQVAQITVRGKGALLRVEERSDDIFASVDNALEKISRQIERYKGRRWRGRGDGRPAASLAGSPEPEPSESAMQVVRRKKFALTPMDEQEALEQMALLSHEDFFLFLNSATNQINVLYRRRDGSYGLLEPEIG